MSSLEEIKKSTFLDDVELRFLNNNDIAELKRLCLDWFPLRYPDTWYKQVTNNPRFFSLAATYHGETIGVIIAEIRSRHQCNKEDRDILGYWYPSDTKIAYILIVGASKEYRRRGIASFLLNTFLTKVQSCEHQNCKAVYLHVLASNVEALLFYERQQFKRHKHLPLYYTINQVKMDGYCYVMYVNNGKPPFSFKFYRGNSRLLSNPFSVQAFEVCFPTDLVYTKEDLGSTTATKFKENGLHLMKNGDSFCF